MFSLPIDTSLKTRVILYYIQVLEYSLCPLIHLWKQESYFIIYRYLNVLSAHWYISENKSHTFNMRYVGVIYMVSAKYRITSDMKVKTDIIASIAMSLILLTMYASKLMILFLSVTS
jgi:hypothetical protein